MILINENNNNQVVKTGCCCIYENRVNLKKADTLISSHTIMREPELDGSHKKVRTTQHWFIPGFRFWIVLKQLKLHLNSSSLGVWLLTIYI
jgi:hypothetical protein